MKNNAKYYITEFYEIIYYTNGSKTFWHRIDGPAYSIYRDKMLKNLRHVSYQIYNKPFYPWWKTTRVFFYK